MEELFNNSDYQNVLQILANGDLQAAIESLKQTKFPNKPLTNFLVNALSDNLHIEIDDNLLDEMSVLRDLVRFSLALKEGGFEIGKTGSIGNAAFLAISKFGIEISERSGNYPCSAISAAVWMDGYEFCQWAGWMASFFNYFNATNQEAQMLFMRAKVTNSIMSHYPHEVGPAMVNLGECLIRLGDKEQAVPFFNAVVLDFDRFIDLYEQNDEEMSMEDSISISSLRRAYCGFIETSTDPIGSEQKIQRIDRILDRSK